MAQSNREESPCMAVRKEEVIARFQELVCYEMWNGPAPMKPYSADRCNPPAIYWIHDYSIGYLGGWGAHPLDIMVWGSDADLSGPIVDAVRSDLISLIILMTTDVLATVVAATLTAFAPWGRQFLFCCYNGITASKSAQ